MDTKTGAITVKKGKKFTVTIQVATSGNANYNKARKLVKVTIAVK